MCFLPMPLNEIFMLNTLYVFYYPSWVLTWPNYYCIWHLYLLIYRSSSLLKLTLWIFNSLKPSVLLQGFLNIYCLNRSCLSLQNALAFTMLFRDMYQWFSFVLWFHYFCLQLSGQERMVIRLFRLESGTLMMF